MANDLITWKPLNDFMPLRDFDRMRREMDRFWDSFLEGGVRKRGERPGEWFPALDISETKNDIVVKTEIPGLDHKEIDISLSDGVLTIKGEKKQEKESEKENYHLVERSYGTFIRSVRLPQEVKTDKINASYKNGLLKITLPKSEESKKKEIKIKVE